MGKYSFIINHDHESIIDALSDDQAGKLFRMLFAYSKRSETNSCDDQMVNIAFAGIRGFIDSNREKYDEICKKRSEAAKARYNK